MTEEKQDVLQPAGSPPALTPEDDSYHPPTLDAMHWSETHWFSFDQPGSNLSISVYPVLRKNLNIASVALYVWDGSAHAPWLIRYGKGYWQLPFPAMDLTELRLGDLEYDCVEPLKTWDVRYNDGQQISLDLRWSGLREPHLAGKTGNGGHFDQPCQVTGQLTLDGQRYAIDTLGMRDKSWGPRTDLRTGNPDANGQTGGAYTYGTQSADDQFLMYSTGSGNVGQARPASGYLIRDGRKAAIARGTRRVLGRRNGYPTSVEIDLEDESGRRLQLIGTCQNRLAKQAFSTTFAWLSMTEWRAPDGERFLGEDQEVWSPYYSGPRLQQLNTED